MARKSQTQTQAVPGDYDILNPTAQPLYVAEEDPRFEPVAGPSLVQAGLHIIVLRALYADGRPMLPAGWLIVVNVRASHADRCLHVHSVGIEWFPDDEPAAVGARICDRLGSDLMSTIDSWGSSGDPPSLPPPSVLRRLNWSRLITLAIEYAREQSVNMLPDFMERDGQGGWLIHVPGLPNPPPISRRNELTDLYLCRLAVAYERDPIRFKAARDIVIAHGHDPRNMADHVRTARKRGWLSPAPGQGRPGGNATPAALELLAAPRPKEDKTA